MKRAHQYSILAALLVFAAYLFCLVFIILYKAQWTYGDDLQFLVSTAVGDPIPSWVGMQPAIGRFWPLGLIDYDLLLWVPADYKCIAHFILSAFSFVCLTLLTFVGVMETLRKYSLPVQVWVAALTTIMLTASGCYVFMYLVFAERIMAVLIVATFVLFLMLYRTDKWGYALGGLLCATYLVLCKEIMFGVLAVLAGFLLIMDRKATITRKATWYLLLAIAGAYICVYLVYIYPQIQHVYNDERPKFETFIILEQVMSRCKIWFAVLLAALIRCYAIIIKKDREHLVYDAFLLAGFAYMIAMAVLHFLDDYYYFPALAFVTIPTAYYLVYYFKVWGSIAILTLLCYFSCASLPAVIRMQMNRRITTYPMMEQYYQWHSAGYTLVWEEKDLQGWDRTLCDYHKVIHKIWINYFYRISGTPMSFEFEQTPPGEGKWVKFSFERADEKPLEQQVKAEIIE